MITSQLPDSNGAHAEDSDVLRISVEDGVLLAELHRPERRNALTPELIVRLAATWQRVRDDPDIRVAILTGAGSKAFCSGADLASLIPLLSRARPAVDEWDERLLADQRLTNTVFLRGFDMVKPLIVAINGACIAGGTELALAADLRIAASHATFALTEVQRGLIPGAGSLARLPRQVPQAIAMEIILLGESITAARAFEAGLVNRVLPEDEVLSTAKQMAQRIAENAPLAVQQAKRVVAVASGTSLEAAFRAEDDAARIVIRSEDAKEGPRAFVEKRRPNFVGR